MHHTVTDMRSIQSQLDFHLDLLAENSAYASLHKKGTALKDKLKKMGKSTHSADQKTFQDVINFNNKLNAELIPKATNGADPAVTVGAKERFDDLKKQWEASENALKALIENEIDAFNKEYNALSIPSLMLPAAFSN